MNPGYYVEGLIIIILLSIIASRLKDMRDMQRCEHLKSKDEFDGGRCGEHYED
jgi:hypothetical protein